MTEFQVLAWLSPFIILILMVSLVAIVAIQRARQQDIPLIVREFMAAIRRVADRLPQPPGTEETTRGAVSPEQPKQQHAQKGADDEPGELR